MNFSLFLVGFQRESLPECLGIQLPEHCTPGSQLGPQLVQLSLGAHHIQLEPALADSLHRFFQHFFHISSMKSRIFCTRVSLPTVDGTPSCAKPIVETPGSPFPSLGGSIELGEARLELCLPALGDSELGQDGDMGVGAGGGE